MQTPIVSCKLGLDYETGDRSQAMILRFLDASVTLAEHSNWVMQRLREPWACRGKERNQQLIASEVQEMEKAPLCISLHCLTSLVLELLGQKCHNSVSIAPPSAQIESHRQ